MINLKKVLQKVNADRADNSEKAMAYPREISRDVILEDSAENQYLYTDTGRDSMYEDYSGVYILLDDSDDILMPARKASEERERETQNGSQKNLPV